MPEFAGLTALAQASTCCDEKTRKLAFEWLEALGERHEQWAARWTWQHMTLDIHSTQRAEAIHSALQHIISTSDKLNKLHLKCEYFEQDRAFRRFVEQKRRELLHVRQHSRRVSMSARRAPYAARPP